MIAYLLAYLLGLKTSVGVVCVLASGVVFVTQIVVRKLLCENNFQQLLLTLLEIEKYAEILRIILKAFLYTMTLTPEKL